MTLGTAVLLVSATVAPAAHDTAPVRAVLDAQLAAWNRGRPRGLHGHVLEVAGPGVPVQCQRHARLGGHAGAVSQALPVGRQGDGAAPLRGRGHRAARGRDRVRARRLPARLPRRKTARAASRSSCASSPTVGASCTTTPRRASDRVRAAEWSARQSTSPAPCPVMASPCPPSSASSSTPCWRAATATAPTRSTSATSIPAPCQPRCSAMPWPRCWIRARPAGASAPPRPRWNARPWPGWGLHRLRPTHRRRSLPARRRVHLEWHPRQPLRAQARARHRPRTRGTDPGHARLLTGCRVHVGRGALQRDQGARRARPRARGPAQHRHRRPGTRGRGRARRTPWRTTSQKASPRCA